MTLDAWRDLESDIFSIQGRNFQFRAEYRLGQFYFSFDNQISAFECEDRMRQDFDLYVKVAFWPSERTRPSFSYKPEFFAGGHAFWDLDGDPVLMSGFSLQRNHL